MGIDLLYLMGLLVFLSPAYAADGAAAFARFWPGPNPAIWTAGLGAHKTVVGFALGVGAALGAAFAVGRLVRLERFAWLDEAWHLPGGEGGSGVAWLVHGLLLGVGALGGDAVASYFKRRRGITPGRPWMPFDQIDFLAGALLLTWPFVELRWVEILVVAAATFVGHLGASWVAYRLGIRVDPV